MYTDILYCNDSLTHRCTWNQHIRTHMHTAGLIQEEPSESELKNLCWINPCNLCNITCGIFLPGVHGKESSLQICGRNSNKIHNVEVREWVVNYNGNCLKNLSKMDFYVWNYLRSGGRTSVDNYSRDVTDQSWKMDNELIIKTTDISN